MRSGGFFATVCAGVFVAASLMVAGTGCSVDGYSRTVDYTHWHDDETLIVVYSREKTMGTFLLDTLSPQPETSHVRVCQVQEDNSMQCRHQRPLTNMLNHNVSEEVDLADDWREPQQ